MQPAHGQGSGQPAAAVSLDRLSPRESEVLGLASSGMTNTQIAYRLQLSVHGVKFHLASTYRKLGVTNRTEAAFVFLNVRAPRRADVAREDAGPA